MFGVLALVMQLGVAVPAAGPGPCDDRVPMTEVQPQSGFRRSAFGRLIHGAIRWVRGEDRASDTICARAPHAVSPMPRSASFALPWVHDPCDDHTEDQDKNKGFSTLPDWAPPYSSLWIPEPEFLLTRFPVDPECDDSIAAALSGGASLAMAPRRVIDRLGL
jgi:hypothetical protein